MKRTIYIFLALSVLLNAACTEIDTGTTPQHPESQYPYIFFDAEVLQTKSNLITEASLPTAQWTAFGVFGYRKTKTETETKTETKTETVFENEKMYRPSGGGAFIYNELKTWTDAQHDFFAYYPYDANAKIGFDTESKPYITYTQPSSLDAMVDIMTASTTIEKPSGTAVPLTFQHRLFALDVIIVNKQEYSGTTPLVINSAEITFTDVCNGAKLYFDSTENSNNTDDYVTITYSSTESESISIAAPTQSGENWTYQQVTINGDNSFLFLPCESISVNISLQGEDYWGKLGTYDSEKEDYYLIGSAQIGPFIAGKRYTLEITKTDAEGFEADINGWEPINDINFTFQ